MNSINLKYSWLKFIGIAIICLNFSCETEDYKDGNGLSTDGLVATFVKTQGSNANNFVLTSNPNPSDFVFHFWNIDDGAGSVSGSAINNLFLPDIGTYKISHSVYGKGGSSQSSTQTIVVTTADPNSGNLVQGAKFETADDISKWTVLTISASGTAWTFANGKAKVTGGGWNQQAIYQAINVIAGKTYKIDMVVSSTTGVSNTWFEVFASTTAPTQNSDYGTGKVAQINTWAGCGGSPFSGKLSNVGCDTTNEGKFTATVTGVIYLVIKCGGENLKDGIAIDNVELRGVQ